FFVFLPPIHLPPPDITLFKGLPNGLWKHFKRPPNYPQQKPRRDGICSSPQHDHPAESVRMSAFGAKRTSRERRKRPDLTKMTQSGERIERPKYRPSATLKPT